MDLKDTLDACDLDDNIEPLEHTDEDYNELVDTYAVAKRLLPFMAKRGIPASPQNYRLFYDYLIFSNSEMNRAINNLFTSNASFNQALATGLYHQFYTNELNKSQTQVINQAACEFIAISSAMEQNLENAKIQTDHYQKILADSSRQISDKNNLDGIQPMLSELLAETEMALVRHTRFSEQITEANCVIADLKAELKNQTALALIDELTKLYNRRYLNQEVPNLMERSKALNEPLTAIVFDLDKFKLVNDTWGHNFGDKILILCADLMKKMARDTDLVIRLGGEEFILLCPGLNLANAAKVAARIRVALANTDITIRENSLHITISGGVAEYIYGEDLNSFVGRADKALYQAKNDGRNCIRIADESAEMGPHK